MMSKQTTTRKQKLYLAKRSPGAAEDSFQDAERYLKFSPISFLLVFLFAIPVLGYLVSKYYGRDPYGDFAMLLLVLGIIGLIGSAGMAVLFKRNFFKFQHYYYRNTDVFLNFILFVFVLFAGLGFVWFLLGSTLRYALSNTELYFYYISAAIIEELFFRMFLCGVPKTYLIELRKRGQNKFPEAIENISIAISTAVIFMLAHLTTYGNTLIGITAMFFGGILFALFYLYTKDITITMVAHIWVNIIAVSNLIMTAGGV